jgi:hypothetical protein
MPQVVVEHRTHTNTLSAKSLKATIVLAPNEVAALSVPDGKPRSIVRVNVAGRIVTADLNAKSVRKAIASIHASGPDNVVCILQGKLASNDALEEAGLAVQTKAKAEAPTAD